MALQRRARGVFAALGARRGLLRTVGRGSAGRHPSTIARCNRRAARSFSSGAAPEDQRASFDRDGFLVVENFASADECAAMRDRMATLVDEWDGLSQTVRRRRFRTRGHFFRGGVLDPR